MAPMAITSAVANTLDNDQNGVGMVLLQLFGIDEDMDALVYQVTSNMFNGIVDLGQVESLMFCGGWEADENGELTIPVYENIPIS